MADDISKRVEADRAAGEVNAIGQPIRDIHGRMLRLGFFVVSATPKGVHYQVEGTPDERIVITLLLDNEVVTGIVKSVGGGWDAAITEELETVPLGLAAIHGLSHAVRPEAISESLFMTDRPFAIRPVSRAILSKADIHEDGYFGTRPRNRFIAGFDIVEENDEASVVIGHQSIDSVDLDALNLVRKFAAAPELYDAAVAALAVLGSAGGDGAADAAEKLRTAILKAQRGVFVFQREEDAILLQNELGRPFR